MVEKHNVSVSPGWGWIWLVAQALLVAGKLFGNVEWSWFMVFTPTWIVPVVAIVVFVAAFIVGFLVRIVALTYRTMRHNARVRKAQKYIREHEQQPRKNKATLINPGMN